MSKALHCIIVGLNVYFGFWVCYMVLKWCISFVLGELQCGNHGVRGIIIGCIIVGYKMVQLNTNNMQSSEDWSKTLNTNYLP
jgi:hypothetical protein